VELCPKNKNKNGRKIGVLGEIGFSEFWGETMKMGVKKREGGGAAVSGGGSEMPRWLWEMVGGGEMEVLGVFGRRETEMEGERCVWHGRNGGKKE
jgi:hypothetical protein